MFESALKNLLESAVFDDSLTDLLSNFGVPKEKQSISTAVVAVLIMKALSGDNQSLKLLFDLCRFEHLQSFDPVIILDNLKDFLTDG